MQQQRPLRGKILVFDKNKLEVIASEDERDCDSVSPVTCSLQLRGQKKSKVSPEQPGGH